MPDKVLEILNAFDDALQFWALNVSSDLKSSVPPATVAEPLQELVKIAKLIKAHTTKVGIIFEPSKLKTQLDAAYSTASELLKSVVLYMSALALLLPQKVSTLFYKEVVDQSASLVAGATLFVKELKHLYGEVTNGAESVEPEKDAQEVNQRLVSIGRVWATCDLLVTLIENGNLKFLEQKTKMHIGFIDDGLDEFAEWAENPGELDDEDPFGLDDFSDEDDTEPPAEEEEESSDDREQLIQYSKLWLQKFKLVKVLFLSINKSLPSITKGTDIDQIYEHEAKATREIDLLIVELMMNRVVDDPVDKHALAVDKACYDIIAILKSANKSSESKVKWCGSWEARYKELLADMYS